MSLLLKLLNPRLLVGLALAAFLAFTHISAYRSGRSAIQAKWDAANVASERSAQQQAERMRELQRASERKYIVAAQTRDRFIVTTVRELHDAAAPLADCRLPDAVRVRLNAAAGCARGDSATACGADDGMPHAR